MVLLMVRIEARISQVTIHCKKKQVSALEGVLEQKEAKVPMTDFYNNNKERERETLGTMTRFHVTMTGFCSSNNSKATMH